jgi:hypothetical protein
MTGDLVTCPECEEQYNAAVLEEGRCVYCRLKRCFVILKAAGGIGAGEAAFYAEAARQSVYFGKNPDWPRLDATATVALIRAAARGRRTG